MWTITQDFIDDSRAIGISSVDFEESQAASLTTRFRLLDGDGNVYYEGLSDDGETENLFAPLDDFGTGFSGCTTLQFLVDGQWTSIN